MSDRLQILSSGDAAVFRNHYPHDSIFVKRFSLDGRQIGPDIFLVNSVRLFEHRFYWAPPGGLNITSYDDAEYLVEPLPSGKLLFVWTRVEQGGGTNIYARILDQNLNWYGPPKRINSDTTGMQFAPCLAMKGDTAYVAWYDTRSGEQHVYMRRFTAGDVTAVGQLEVPTEFSLHQNYPNPFREETTISFSLQERAFVTLQVRDLLGRTVKTLLDGEMERGERSVRLEGSGMRPGLYWYSLVTAGGMRTRLLVKR